MQGGYIFNYLEFILKYKNKYYYAYKYKDFMIYKCYFKGMEYENVRVIDYCYETITKKAVFVFSYSLIKKDIYSFTLGILLFLITSLIYVL